MMLNIPSFVRCPVCFTQYHSGSVCPRCEEKRLAFQQRVEWRKENEESDRDDTNYRARQV